MLQKNPTKRLGAGELLKKYYRDGRAIYGNLVTTCKNITSGKSVTEKSITEDKVHEVRTNNFLEKSEGKDIEKVEKVYEKN